MSDKDRWDTHYLYYGHGVRSTLWAFNHYVDRPHLERIVKAKRLDQLRDDIRSIANPLGGIGFSA